MGAGGYKRIKLATFQSPTTPVTVTFDEPEPLDPTHVLIVVAVTSNGAPAVSGWQSRSNGTDAAGGWRIAVRQADGVANGVTLLLGSTNPTFLSVALFAYPGWVSTLAALGFSAGTVTETGATASTPAAAGTQDRIILAIARGIDIVAVSPWTGMPETVSVPHLAVGLLPTNDLTVARTFTTTWSPPSSNMAALRGGFFASPYTPAPPAPSRTGNAIINLGGTGATRRVIPADGNAATVLDATTTSPVATHVRTGTATIGLDGTAEPTVRYARTGDATLTLDGETAAPIVTARATGTGVLNLAGTATGRVTHTRTGDGTLELDGTATGTATLVRTGNAALTLTGMGDNRGRRDLRIIGITETARTVAARDTSRIVAIDNRTRHVNIEETSA